MTGVKRKGFGEGRPNSAIPVRRHKIHAVTGYSASHMLWSMPHNCCVGFIFDSHWILPYAFEAEVAGDPKERLAFASISSDKPIAPRGAPAAVPAQVCLEGPKAGKIGRGLVQPSQRISIPGRNCIEYTLQQGKKSHKNDNRAHDRAEPFIGLWIGIVIDEIGRAHV